MHGSACLTTSTNVWTWPTITKLFHRQPFAINCEAMGAVGFSQKRLTRQTDSAKGALPIEGCQALSSRTRLPEFEAGMPRRTTVSGRNASHGIGGLDMANKSGIIGKMMVGGEAGHDRLDGPSRGHAARYLESREPYRG
jgi:hypothetical protein